MGLSLLSSCARVGVDSRDSAKSRDVVVDVSLTLWVDVSPVLRGDTISLKLETSDRVRGICAPHPAMKLACAASGRSRLPERPFTTVDTRARRFVMLSVFGSKEEEFAISLSLLCWFLFGR